MFMVTESTSAQRLPLRIKASYGLGTLAFGIKDQGFSTLLLLFYNQVIGVPASWVGATIMVAMIFDALADPLIGHVSDHWTSPLGRRHPFMYASALPAAVTFFLLWSPPKAGPIWQCLWLGLTAVAVRISVSLFEIPNAALATEFTEDYEERTRLQTWRGLFVAVGATVFALIVFKVFMVAGADGRPGQLNRAGYWGYSWFASLTMAACILLSSWGTQDRGRTLVAKPAEGATGKNFLEGLRTVFLDPAYVYLLGAVFAVALAAAVSVALGGYLMTYYWQISASQLGTIAAANILALFFGITLVNVLKRFDKKKMTIIMVGATLVSCCVMPLAGLFGLVTPADPLLIPLLAAQSVVVCTFILAVIIFAASMQADVGDYFRLKTGHPIEGVMFSAGIMVNKAVSGVGVFLTGVVLSFIGFPEKAVPGELNQNLINELGWANVGVIAGLCGLSMIFLQRFPITRAVHADILAQLHRRAGQGTVD